MGRKKKNLLLKTFQQIVFFQRRTVLYAQVTEYQIDKGKQTGKTVYLYDNQNITDFTTYTNTPLSREPSNWLEANYWPRSSMGMPMENMSG